MNPLKIIERLRLGSLLDRLTERPFKFELLALPISTIDGSPIVVSEAFRRASVVLDVSRFELLEIDTIIRGIVGYRHQQSINPIDPVLYRTVRYHFKYHAIDFILFRSECHYAEQSQTQKSFKASYKARSALGS